MVTKQTKKKKHLPTTKPPRDVERYLRMIETDKPFLFCKDQKKLVHIVRNAFAAGDIWFNNAQYQSYLKIGQAMFPEVLPWQKFLCALMLCTYKCIDDRPRWTHALVMLARGAGKDGVIAWFGLCTTSKNNPIKKYDVDICANNEKQSMRPVKDAIDFLKNPVYLEANKASFYWTSEKVVGLENGGTITGHTNNARGKDGLRSGMVILNEIHEYEEYANIDVFLTGMGKVSHGRSIYFTTNGNVREGVLDDELAAAESILNDETADNGTLPFICRIDDKKEAYDEKCWYKANPSLYYFPDLFDETKKDFLKWKDAPATLPGFMAKRMNLPVLAAASAVTEYEHIKATNKPIPFDKIERAQCTVGIDTSSVSDFTSVTAVFKLEGQVVSLNHTWVCKQSRDMPRIKFKSEFPRLIDMGLVTIVDDVEIPPSAIADYIQELKMHYRVMCVALDDFKYAVYAQELAKIGFNKDAKNLKLLRPSDIARVVPIIESAFARDVLVWGDNPMLRWATNNTKVVPWKSTTVNGADVGARRYAKIEPKSRKTDPFMSFVHAMTQEAILKEAKPMNKNIFRARVY